jgi:lipopolysaccharide export system protein LptA
VLVLSLASGFDSVEDARFVGAVKFADGEMRADAPEALYRTRKGVVELTMGESPSAARAPHMNDARIAVDARRITFAIDGGSLEADGDVKSILQSEDDGQPARGARPTPAPGESGERLLKRDRPVNITGDKLAYDSAARRAVYTGNARLWQDETVVQGDVVTLDRQTGALQAEGSVRSTFLLEQTDEKTKAVTKTPAIAVARRLDYDDEAGRAVYTTNAQLNGPQGHLTADRIELYLTTAGDAVERAEAYTAVTMRKDNRTAFGDRLTYVAADERYVMVGAPAKLVEDDRQTTGRILTFFRSTGRILVDGQEQRRTQTTSVKPPPEHDEL